VRNIRHEKEKPMGKYQLVTKDGRIDIMVNRTRVVGYVEDDTLTAIDAQGYAVPIGAINHRAEIIGKLDAWRAANPHQ
jgi:formylmethanofuran dehydrogenase subunit A